MTLATALGPMARPVTVGAAQRALVAAFVAAGVDSPALDARRLLAHVTGLDGAGLLQARDQHLDEPDLIRLDQAAARRMAGEPVSRIIGARWFYGRPFLVTPATLDPRPETETLIEAAKALLVADGPLDRPLRLLDIGTGTGCIALTLLAELPNATAVASDISPAALTVARKNAERHGLTSRVAFCDGSGFAPVSGTFDLIVSNPPYIPTADLAGLARDVREHDPALALDGGVDGLAVYRQLAVDIFSYLSDGWIVFEVGHDQAAAVCGLLETALPAGRGAAIRRFADLAGVDRCVAVSPRPAVMR